MERTHLYSMKKYMTIRNSSRIFPVLIWPG